MSKKKPDFRQNGSQPKEFFSFLDELGIDNCDIDFKVPPPSDLERAQEFIYDAWEAQTQEKAIILAEKALSISDDCADAYNLLAEEKAKTVKEQLEYYRQGIKAGERALGEAIFEEEIGYFWGLLSTRPYMRAKAGLANSLRLMGDSSDAVDHYKDMLRLNPNDNQGIRYILLPFLVELGRIDEAEQLYKEYKDDGMAAWSFSRALLDFIKYGDSKISTLALANAMQSNKYIPEYLLGKKEISDHMQDFYVPGRESEAASYCQTDKTAWQSISGALDWMKSSIAALGH